jgi:hypothetical protein
MLIYIYDVVCSLLLTISADMLVNIMLKIFINFVFFLEYSKYFVDDRITFVKITTIYGCQVYVYIKENCLQIK